LVLEKDVEAALVRHAKKKNMLSYKFTSPSCRGVCDRIFISEGRVLFMEIKRSSGRLTDLQIRHQETLKKHGANAVVVYGIEQGKEVLDGFFEGKGFER